MVLFAGEVYCVFWNFYLLIFCLAGLRQNGGVGMAFKGHGLELFLENATYWMVVKGSFMDGFARFQGLLICFVSQLLPAS